jgi:RNA polymerase sigma-70 factor, ECF subfamily
MPVGDNVWRERELRRAVLAGDELAWRTWYEESFAGLEAYVLWRCAGLCDVAEDIIQETWLTAVRRVRAFDPERGTFACWLRGIAANVIRHQFRRMRARHRPQPLDGVDKPVPPSTEAAQRATAERIGRALAQLPERYEAALQAKYLDQQSVEQIARSWQETPKAVESLLSRARQAFREVFANEE